MPRSSDCPSCGPTLEYAGAGRTMQRAYCCTIVQVPQELWQPVEAARTASQWKGVGGSIFAATIPFVLNFFVD